MELRSTNNQPATPLQALRYVDWVTVALYLIMVVCGAFSIYAASYDFDHASVFSFAEFSGKQFMWIGISFTVGFILLLTDARMFETYAYPIYLAVILLLIVTIFIAPNINGSRSWIVLGGMSIQPAEFAKFATALALAKLFGTYGWRLNESWRSYAEALSIFMVPMVLIVLQHETGSALVFMSLFFVLYREGMSGLVMLAALCSVVFFVVALKYADVMWLGIPKGQVIVFIMIMIVMVLMLAVYCRSAELSRNVFLWFAGTGIIEGVLAACGWALNGYAYFITVILVACVYCVLMMLRGRAHGLLMTVGAVVASVVFLFSTGMAFNTLKDYQQKRVRVALGIEEDKRDAGYNVNQSMIAIGSGGIAGKGYLNGTQTKLKYVPEQHTDFIFCTVGEEEGFLGASAVIIAFVVLILRVITIAERQPTTFARVYAYCVASYFMFHLCINVGMVIGLCPVIGIPLPFFSYGGSSILGFTILLFILLRLDSARRDRIR